MLRCTASRSRTARHRPRQGARAAALSDSSFHQLTRAAAIIVLVILGGVIVSLFIGSLPALRAFGFDFLIDERWNPVTEKFGAHGADLRHVVTSFIAMLIAVPVGLLIALFLTELCPMWLRRPIGIAIELLAGIPSIIYGIWGLFVFAPFLQQTLQPFLITVFGDIPVLSSLFAGPPYGIGMLTAGPDPRHHGAAVHHLDLARRVRRGAAGAEGSGLRPRLHHLGGRALCGAALHAGRRHRRRHARSRPRARRDHGGDLRDRQCARISASILAPGTTISATIANEFTEAVGDLYTSSLIALGLILFVITFIVLAAARYMLMRIERRIG